MSRKAVAVSYVKKKDMKKFVVFAHIQMLHISAPCLCKSHIYWTALSNGFMTSRFLQHLLACTTATGPTLLALREHPT